MNTPINTKEYREFIRELKNRIQSAQLKAAVSVNQTMLQLYWDLAERIIARQQASAWGDGILGQISHDLQSEFPDMTGFSLRNLHYMRQWYQFWSGTNAIVQQAAAQLDNALYVQQLVSQIPWWHNVIIISKIKDQGEALFYVQQTIQNNWSRAVLTHHIESRLYQREGKAITNFKATLPAPQSDLARQILKDPYNFDFLLLRKKHDEKELEDALIEHVTRFLLELGAGFSYIGRQYKLEVGGYNATRRF